MLRRAQTWCNTIIFIADDTKEGDIVKAPNGTRYQIKYILDPLKPEVKLEPTTEVIPSMELEVGDQLEFNGSYATITGLNKEQGTYYIYVDAKSNLTGKKLPSIKIPKKSDSVIKSRKHMSNVYLIELDEVVKKLLRMTCDISAMNAAPDRVEVQPSVFVDKGAIQSAQRTELKALANRAAELSKKV